MRPSRRVTERARELRRQAPSPERRLWQVLKDLNREGCHFRRQAPIGPYFVDFAWLSLGLVIEIDGDGHFTPDAMAADRRRDRFLASRGLTVLRFSNSEAFTSTFDVGQRVLAVANELLERRGASDLAGGMIALCRCPTLTLPSGEGRETMASRQSLDGCAWLNRPKPHGASWSSCPRQRVRVGHFGKQQTRPSPGQRRPYPRSLRIRAWSRCQSRFFSVSRLSWSFLPRASAI
ncbi:endonuclease domain-containing protein [Phreatobacter oligotrophus]|uniref:endonuclease domain-containing protein n=1 Tax=Phreatobacter oligotrophus TaxID=1122261 RepID=UPI003B5A9AA5|nr:endonuclease domain-containing protein [Phreatobacter oligotrophus]